MVKRKAVDGISVRFEGLESSEVNEVFLIRLQVAKQRLMLAQALSREGAYPGLERALERAFERATEEYLAGARELVQRIQQSSKEASFSSR